MRQMFRIGFIIICLFQMVITNKTISGDEILHPNVIVILTDDQGWGDLSLHGNQNLKTPNIDSIATNGVQFQHFYVSPVCSPTRSEFLTGRYHPRSGVRNVTSGGERLNLNEVTIANYFKDSGYATGAFGKWHNGSQYPYHPNGRGFDEYYGFTSGHWGDYFSPPLEHNGKIVKGEGFIADDITNHALEFMESAKNKPFFCYVAYNTPHSPMQVPDLYYNRFKNFELQSKYHGKEKEDIDFTRTALAMCENLDFNIGRILNKMNEMQISNDTIIVYFHDNGPNGWRYNGSMRGRKGSTDEGGVRSPLFIRWPGHIKPGMKVERIASTIDILPTLMDLTGIMPKYRNSLDGISFAGCISEGKSEPGDRKIFSHWAGKVSVRTQTHRLDDKGRLYDMQADPGQTTDIRKSQPELADLLDREVQKWRNEVLSGLDGRDNRPFPVGYRDFPITHLPARDALFTGSVKRSAPAPNCSFLTNWSKTTDSIYWPVEIETAGEYDLVFHYTMAEANRGVKIVISFNSKVVSEFQLDQAFDPPLTGMEHDRVSRGSESYVKDFKPLEVKGVMLPKAQGELKIQAQDVKGNRVVDLRGISLILKTDAK
jgi:arylsulfatase A-like enzyme